MTTYYNYDVTNRLTSVNSVTYTWDDNGNLLSDGVNTYTYDHANRLVSVTRAGTTSTYQYNGLSDRVRETNNGITTNFTLDLNTGLTQVLSDGTNTYLYGTARIGQFTASDSAYFLGDALGSVRQLVDSAGAVTMSKSYEPYGEVLGIVGSGSSSYGFTGEQTDASGLIYLRARYYSSNNGRFLSKDAWKGNNYRPLSFNKWNYGYSNPLTYTDPSGNCPDMDGDGRCSAILDEVKKFQSKYGITIAGYNMGRWECNSNELMGVIDGTYRVGKRFAQYLKTSPPVAFRQAFDHITYKLDSSLGGYFGLQSAYEVSINPGKVSNNLETRTIVIQSENPLSRLVVHELGHVFWYHLAIKFARRNGYKTGTYISDPLHPATLLNQGIYELDGRFVKNGSGGNFVTGYDDITDTYKRNGGSEYGYKGDDYYYSSGGYTYITGYQWHSENMEGGNSNDEEWADIFQNWVFNSFANNNAGSAINDWVSTYMPKWLEVATGRSLSGDQNGELR